MKRAIFLALAFLFAAPMAALAAGTAPILVVTNQTYTNPNHLDPAQVIEGALNARHYTISDRRPGAIDAYYVGNNGVRADLTVSYTDSTYSITYRDSQGLNYGNGRIDAHYNHWVHNLDHDLQVAFGDIPAGH
jgi:hypothetical protein